MSLLISVDAFLCFYALSKKGSIIYLLDYFLLKVIVLDFVFKLHFVVAQIIIRAMITSIISKLWNPLSLRPTQFKESIEPPTEIYSLIKLYKLV